MGRIIRVLRWAWRGIEILDIFLSLGLLAMIWAALKDFTAGWEWYHHVAFFVGQFLVLLTLLVRFHPLLWGWIEHKRGKIEPKVETPKWEIVNDALIGAGFEFFPSRDILSRHHSLSERILSVPTVWALWPTGTYATGVIDAIQSGNIKRLMLPHPQNSPIKELAALTGNKPEDIVNDIKRTARKALEKRKEQNNRKNLSPQDIIEPRWYLGMITNSIMLGNPEPLVADSWVQVENLIPLKTESRSSYALTFGLTPFKPLFVKVKDDFEQIWRDSIPIKDSDLHLPVREPPLSEGHVAERHAFIKQLQAVAERLFKNSQGAEVQSVYSIVHDICKESPMENYISKDGLANQAVRLLMHQLDDLFGQVSSYQRDTIELSIADLDNTSICSFCNTTNELILYYRRLVDETMGMLKNLENRGLESFWHKNPWSVRIHRELADNYDELMRLVRDLKAITPSDARDLLPNDDQTSKFPRSALYS